MAQLDAALMDVPVLRTMLGLERFDQEQALMRGREVGQVMEVLRQLSEMQSLPAQNRFREAQASKAEYEVQDSRDLRNLQTRLPEILRRGDPEEIEAAYARLDPQGYVRGQFRDRNEGLPDPVKLQRHVRLLDDAFVKTQDPRYKAEADQLRGILTQRATSAREAKVQSYMDTIPGISRQDAIALADGHKRLSFNPVSGAIVLMDTIGAMQGGQPAAGAPGAAPGTFPSPYSPPASAPGVREVVPGTKHTERLYKETEELADKIDKKSIPTLDEAAKGMEAIFRKYPQGKIPGLGLGISSPMLNPVYGAMSVMGSEHGVEAERNRAQVARWMQNILQLSAGLSQTASEKANTLNSILSSGTASEAAKRAAYNDWRHAYESAKSSLFAGVPPEVIRQYFRGKGQPARLWAPTSEAAEALAREFERRGITSPTGAEGTAEYQIELGEGRDYGAAPREESRRPRTRIRLDSQGREIR